MARIADEELAELKASISLERLVELEYVLVYYGENGQRISTSWCSMGNLRVMAVS